MCCRQCGVCLHFTQIMRVTSAGEVCEISPHQSVRACFQCSMSALSSCLCPKAIHRKPVLWFSQILAIHFVFFRFCFVKHKKNV